jgi:RNA polymerase sigma-70 factor (ECF subfamily)
LAAHVKLREDRDGGSPEDAALVGRVRDGDRGASDRLVRRHLRAAHALAASILDSEDDADDVCQDAMVTALDRIEQCKDPRRFEGWLMAIVRNCAFARLRAPGVKRREALDDTSVGSNGRNPEHEAMHAELMRDVQCALTTLTELQRRVLVLHDLEGWRHSEIGDELSISTGSSRVLLHKARRALRSALGPRHAEETT